MCDTKCKFTQIITAQWVIQFGWCRRGVTNELTIAVGFVQDVTGKEKIQFVNTIPTHGGTRRVDADTKIGLGRITGTTITELSRHSLPTFVTGFPICAGRYGGRIVGGDW